LKHIVFLCGAANSIARPNLHNYLSTWEAETMLVFKADDVWAKIASTAGLNALQMEGLLADLADAVIIIVESPGTFAELGAFSNSEPLRRKLLPVLDIRYRDANSFINSGPVHWVNSDSLFRPTVTVDLSTILVAAKEITDRLDRLEPPSRQRVDNVLRHISVEQPRQGISSTGLETLRHRVWDGKRGDQWGVEADGISGGSTVSGVRSSGPVWLGTSICS
jgi:hypothetical protein